MRKAGIILLIILVILGGGLFYLSTFKLQEIEVVGCEMASEDAVREVYAEKCKFDNTLELLI